MITVERLNLRGEGVAGDLTVARALPGETVDGAVVDGRIAQPKILAPSADRVSASCPHYKACGGCTLMHASDSFVENWKTQVVRNALFAQGLDAEYRPIAVSPPRSRRRATLAGRRLKSGALVGFHARASDTVTAIPNCELLHPDLLTVIPALEAMVMAGGSRKGELRFTVTQVSQGVDVAVSTGKPLDTKLRISLSAIAGEHGLARLTWGDETLLQKELPTVAMGAANVSPPPGSFLQATRHGETVLRDAVLEAVGDASRIADLFSGCGTFALPLSRTAEVHAVEGLKSMLDALDRGWRGATGLKRVTTEARDLFRRPMLVDEIAQFQAIVLDPPRAGAQAQVLELAKADVPLLAMVSCNPVSFARDARVLVDAGLSLEWVQVVDQFRWSSHVELVAKFVRA